MPVEIHENPDAITRKEIFIYVNILRSAAANFFLRLDNLYIIMNAHGIEMNA